MSYVLTTGHIQSMPVWNLYYCCFPSVL